MTLVFWASAFTGIRAALEHFSPGHLALYRFLVASVTLLIYLVVARLPRPAPRDLWQIAGLSVAGISLYHALLNYGEQTVPAGTARRAPGRAAAVRREPPRPAPTPVGPLRAPRTPRPRR